MTKETKLTFTVHAEAVTDEDAKTSELAGKARGILVYAGEGDRFVKMLSPQPVVTALESLVSIITGAAQAMTQLGMPPEIVVQIAAAAAIDGTTAVPGSATVQTREVGP